MSLVRDDSSFWAEKINGATTTSHRIEEYYFFLSSAPYPVSRIESHSNEIFKQPVDQDYENLWTIILYDSLRKQTSERQDGYVFSIAAGRRQAI
jgi:hypothetical protein